MNTNQLSAAIKSRTQPDEPRLPRIQQLQGLMAEKNKMLADAKQIIDGAKSGGIGLTLSEQNKVDDLIRQSDSKQAEADVVRGDMERIDVGPEGGRPISDGLYPFNAPASRGTSRRYSQMFGANLSNDGWHSKAEFLRCICAGMFDNRLNAAGMSEGIPSEGGFLVPSALAADLLDAALENEIVRPRADVRPMTTSELRVSGLDDSNHTQLYGFSSEWLEEGAEATLQTPKTRSILLKAKKNVLLTSLTNELQADMMTSTEPKLWEQLTKAVAFSIDNVLLSGSGAGQPLGALNGSSVVEIAAETGQATGSIVVENIVKMAARLYPPCFGNAVWVTHPSALPQLLTLQTKIRNDEDEVVGGGQSGLLQPDGKGGYTILARPLLISEKMQAVGSRGDLAIVDFSEYIVGLRKEVSIDKSAHVFFASDKTAIRCIVRLDGQPKWSSAITPKNGTDTLSWAVVLGARS